MLSRLAEQLTAERQAAKEAKAVAAEWRVRDTMAHALPPLRTPETEANEEARLEREQAAADAAACTLQ